MITQLQTQIKATSTPSFTLVRSGMLRRKCACGNHTVAGGECAACRKKREGMMLQRAPASAAPLNGVPPIVHEVLCSPGQPLASATRAFMEPRFGHDFSQVRVHADTKAAESAKAVNALAYTVGRDVVFGEGQYAPSSNTGKRLMTHELTHVVQQHDRPAALNSMIVDHGENHFEKEAQTMADHLAPDSTTASPTIDNAALSDDTHSTLRRWKNSGNVATANDESDTLGGLALKVGAHFNDWKCIKPLKMRTFEAGTATERQKKNYERFVRIGDQFDVSNLTAKTGPELKVYLFSDDSERMDAEIVKKFYPGSVPSSGDPDTDIETAANTNFGGTPVSSVLIFGHAAGGSMWGKLGRFKPSDFAPEEPAPSYGLAESGYFPRRCWLTRNAMVRLVGCDSEVIGQSFANAYLRTGASVTTTTRAVGSYCTTMPIGALRCEHPDALLFAAFSSRIAPIVDGPFTSAGDFHLGKFWKTFKGKL